MTDACKMRDMLLLVAATLLLGAAQSRSVHLDLVNLVKNIASRAEGAETNGDFLYNHSEGNEGTGDVAERGVENNSKIGFILFGNLEDLEKYRIDLKENEDENKYNSEMIINRAYEVKENTNDLVVNPQISVGVQDDINGKEEEKTNDGILLTLQDDFEAEDDDSEDYENVDETDRKDKIVIDIFTEDEYNDYNDKDNAAEDVANEEDESEEERFYDEDEKYYENENDKSNNPQDNGGELPFDGIFMEDSKK